MGEAGARDIRRQDGRGWTIKVCNHPALGSAPPGYSLFEISSGDPARPRSEWETVTAERNPFTDGEFRLPGVFFGQPPRLAQILDAIDRALIEVAEGQRPKCASHGCAGTAVLEVAWPGKTVQMCGPCASRAYRVAEAMGFTLETRPMAESA